MERRLRRRWKIIFTPCASATRRCSASSSCACSNAPCAARPPSRTAPPPQLAAEEMDRLVTEWFAEVLQSPPTKADQMLSTRGRLALLLADMPGKWQDQFLRPGPWPEEFVHRHARGLLARRPGFSAFQNDAAPAGPRPHHHADQSGPDCPISAWCWSGRCSRCCWSRFSGSRTEDSSSEHQLSLLIDWFRQLTLTWPTPRPFPCAALPRVRRGWRLFIFYSSALLLTGLVSMLFADLLWRTRLVRVAAPCCWCCSSFCFC